MLAADVLKTKQKRGKKRNFKDTDMEIEAKSTNNEDQLLNKVIPLPSHVFTDGGASLHEVFWSGSTLRKY